MSSTPLDISAHAVRERILDPLARLRRWTRGFVLLNGGVKLLTAILLGATGQLLLDRWLNLTTDQRALVNVGLTLFWLSVFYRRVLLLLIRPIPDRVLATAVDRAHPELCDQIATAVQFHEGRVGAAESNSPLLVQAVLADACAAAGRVSFERVLDREHATRNFYSVVGLLLLLIVPCALLPGLMSTWFRRNWLMQDIPWPQSTYIKPIGYDGDGRRRVPLGDALEVQAEIHGETPNEIMLEWWTPSGRNGRETMTIIGERRAELALGPSSEPVHFRITGGDERTREFIAEAVERPSVSRLIATITPPAYADLEPGVFEQQTMLEMLRGSSMRLDVTLNKPVRSIRFVSASGEAIAAEMSAPDRAHIDWSAPENGSYAFELIDLDGWENRRNVRYTIKVVQDLPPTVRLTIGEHGDAVTPTAELALDVTYADVYGLSRAEIFAQRDDDSPVSIPGVLLESGRRELRVQTKYDLSALHVSAGQRVRLWAEAADNDPAGPNVGRSAPLELRVLSPADLQSELAQRELELRQEFERLISEQSGLREALERVLSELPASGPTPSQTAQRLGGLARRQESHAARVATLQRGFEKILAEMRANRVGRAVDERRITEKITAPLERIAREQMPASSGAMNELRRESDRSRSERLPRQQAELVREMKTVLSHMLENEGFREAIALLQEIIAAQSDVHSATVEALSRQIEAIIGLEDLSPTTRPKP